MGQLFVKFLKDLGAYSYLFDISDERLEIAKGFGANYTFNSRDTSVFKNLLELTEGRGVDAFILTFVTQELLDAAMEYSRDGGRICVFAPPIRELNLKMNYFDFFRREMQMMGSYSSNFDEIELTMQYIQSGRVDVKSMITQTTNLEGMLDAVRNLDDKQLKVIVKP